MKKFLIGGKNSQTSIFKNFKRADTNQKRGKYIGSFKELIFYNFEWKK